MALRPRALFTPRGRGAMSFKKADFALHAWRMAGLAAALASSLLVAGCAEDQQMAAVYIERPVDQIYNAGWFLIGRGDWLNAGRQFDEVERQHPYSIWARRAILMSAYCYYQGNRYQEAIDAADRFIQLHPGNKDVPYAYYLKAVSLYEQIQDVDRDQQRTEDALAALQDLIQR